MGGPRVPATVRCSLGQEWVRDTPAPRGPAPLTPQVTPELAGPSGASPTQTLLSLEPHAHVHNGVSPPVLGETAEWAQGGSQWPGCKLQLWAGPPAVAWTASWNTRVTDLPPTAPQAENLDLGPSASRS